MPPINMPPGTLALNDKTGTNNTGTTSIAAHLQIGTFKLAGRGNIHRKPLLDIDPCFISTIALHIFMGTWLKLFELFIDDVRRDLDGRSEEIIGKLEAFAALALEVTDKQKNIGDVDKEMKEEKSDAADLQKQL